MRTQHKFETTDPNGNKHTILVSPLPKGYAWIVDGKDRGGIFYESDLAEKFERLRRGRVAIEFLGRIDDEVLEPNAKQPNWSIEVIEKPEKQNKRRAAKK